MIKNAFPSNVDQLVEILIEGIKEKKGKNIVIIDLRELRHSVCDYFIVCEGDSNVHAASIAESAEEFAHRYLNEKPRHKEGFENAHWVLVDFFGIVLHVFQKEYRDFYKLEDLWSDGKIINIEDK